MLIYRNDLGHFEALRQATEPDHQVGAQRSYQCSLAGDQRRHHDDQEDDVVNPRRTSGRHCVQRQAGVQE